MRILVTGGAGFIGSHLVDALIARGHTVRILDLLVPQVHGKDADWPAWVPPGVEKIRADVQDPGVWPRAVDGVEAVYHFAAEVGVGQSMYEISRYMGANTMGTAHLLELLAQGRHSVRRLVVASSMSIYGEGLYRDSSGRKACPGVRTVEALAGRRWDEFGAVGERLASAPTPEDKPLEPTSIYAISKRDQEEMCLTVGRAYGIPIVALRFFNVYGRRQSLSNPYTGVAAIFASRILNGRPPVIFEDGAQGRDFVHVSDIVQAALLALSADAAS
jgi:dTDP-L-rhamnose 4-epimerase